MYQRIITAILFLTLIGTTYQNVRANYGDETKNMPPTSTNISFDDVDHKHWAYEFIADMVNRKIIKGYPDGLFRPEKTVTRAEFAVIIVKAAGLQPKVVDKSSFSDIKTTDWHNPFIETAKNYLTGFSLTNGSYNFNPDSPALRENISIGIVKLKGYENRMVDLSVLEAMFLDYESISETAREYIALAVENNLVSGFPDQTFKAQSPITRAQMTAIIWKAFLQGNDNKKVYPISAPKKE